MEKHSGEKAEGLEIVSIGTLYSGPWNKKYWSSSRGKDRYPYPIGYHALRTNAGVTYKMEIQEGIKGPLFMVTSASGDSSSGQTPDIAWGYFQKKGGHRVKNCLGKRFSCKIDGTELFGFRNPFVQRLLRELVANVHGVAEQSLISSNHHNGSSLSEHDAQGQESCVHADLLMYLGKEHGTGKRSRKHRSAIAKATTAACLNSFQSQELTHAVDICTSRQGYGPYLKMAPLKDEIKHSKILCHGPINLKDASLLNMSHDISYSTSSIQTSMQHDPLEKKLTVAERDCNSVLFTNNVPVQSRQSDFFVGGNTVRIGQEDFDPMHMLNKLSTMDNEMLDESLDSDLERVKLLAKAQERGLENSNGATDVKDLDLYIPDSLDIVQDNVGDISSVNEEGNPLSDKDELVAGKPIMKVTMPCAYELSTQDVSKELIRGSEVYTDILDIKSSVREMECHVNECLLDGVSSNGFVKESQSSDLGRHTCSENIHIGFSEQDLARSMMTLLLPRAVPLLTRTYQRKRVRKHSQEMSSVSDLYVDGSNSIRRSDPTCQLNDLPLQSERVELPLKGTEQRMKKREIMVEASSLFQEVKAESTCNDIIDEPITTSGKSGVHPIIPDSFEDDQSAHDHVVLRPLCGSGESAQSLGNSKSYKEQSDIKFGKGEESNMRLPPESRPREGESLIDNSLSACLSPGKYIMSGKSNDVNLDENSLYIASSFPEDETEDIPGSETNDIFHNDFHPLDVEMMPGVEGSLNRMQKDISSARGRKSRHLTEEQLLTISLTPYVQINPNSNGVSSRIDGATDAQHAACAPNVSLDYKKVVCNSEVPFSLTVTANVLPPIGEPHTINGMTGKLPFSVHSPSKNKVPFSESIICRNINSVEVLETYSDKSFCTMENMQDEVDGSGINEKASYDGKQQCLKTSSNISESVGVLLNASPPASQNWEAIKHDSNEMSGFKSGNNLAVAQECRDHILPHQELTKYPHDQSQGNVLFHSDENPPVKSIASNDRSDCPHTELYKCKLCISPLSEDMDPNREPEGFVELIGCYLHPNPVMSILLLAKEGALHVCALCGHSEGGGRDLFIYKVPVEEQINCPSFIGYTPISVPVLKDTCNRTISVERSGLQFTPDGQFLVLLNCFKSPCCREKDLRCLCSICKLDCCEENAVKIVHVQFGYTSTVAKMKTTGRIYCILVCEPDHLLAIEESGELHVWIMNLMWRVNLEEFTLPSFDYMSPSVIELKQVPRCDYLIVGHNGVGGFCLWDISKRVLLSKFSTPGNAISQALPIGLFRFPKEDAFATDIRVEDHVKEILAATDFGPFQASKNDSSLLSTGEGCIAVWLLVSATGLEAPHGHLTMELETSSIGWRPALLAKDIVLMGSVLDPRAASVSTFPGYGICGTSDGCAYIWELATGNKLVDLHCFNGESISCIAVDAKSGAFAVASSKCQLRVYIQSQMPFHKR